MLRQRNEKINIKIILLLILAISIDSCSLFRNTDEPVITGEVTWDYWKANSGWDLRTYYELNPDTFLINNFANKVKDRNLKFVIFASSFCNDCMSELPKIFKIIDMASVPYSSVRLLGLDHDYREPSGLYKQFHIRTLPFVAIYERGREPVIISSPQDDWLKSFIRSIN